MLFGSWLTIASLAAFMVRKHLRLRSKMYPSHLESFLPLTPLVNRNGLDSTNDKLLLQQPYVVGRLPGTDITAPMHLQIWLSFRLALLISNPAS